MQIINHQLQVAGAVVDLPKLAVGATAHVWTVPTVYRDNGYFVSVQSAGEPLEIPACDGREVEYLGSLPLEAATEAVLEAEKVAACARIESTRQHLEQTAVHINWPDGARSLIQTRDDRDWRNINGVASRGLARLTQGSTDEDWFRDADNVDHVLTPTQALDLGYQASAAVSAIAKAAQAGKDAVRVAGSFDAIAAAEAAVAWPA